ncbi:nucleotidyltransferase family protein [Cryobacterium glaciale]|nr:NTP transferase domain-containing protein [Cryobacterium glaciale]
MHLPPPPSRVAGLVLAAGAGSRYGMPKALVHDSAGHSWLQHAVRVLAAAGCSPVIVVLGARGAEAAALLEAGRDDPTGAPARGACQLPASVLVVQAADWAEGLSASLRTGLRCALDQPDVDAVAIIPVDVPDLNAATVARVIGANHETMDERGTGTAGGPGTAGGSGAAGGPGTAGGPGAADAATSPAAVSADTLRQARFAGQPGHPVVIGRAHWVPLIDSIAGDTGARPYLHAHQVEQIECGDLGTGADVDRPN